MRRGSRHIAFAAMAGTAWMLSAAPVLAQAEQDQSESAGTAAGGLDEIIVSAQRREQRAQDVPIAVAAFSSDQMSKLGLTSSNDLPAIVPGLSNSPTPIRTYLYLRGIGTNSVNSSASVLTYIDGVYQPFNPAANDYGGVDRIEIAKGPQGTLFGRNATAGVIQITTLNPLDWQGLDLQVGYANYDTVSARAYGAVKLSDSTGISLGSFYNEQHDGWGTNVVTGDEAFTSKSYGARAKLVTQPDDSFTATLIADYSYNWGQIAAGLPPAVGTRLFNGTTGQTFTLPGRFDFAADFYPFGRNREGGVALTLDKHLGNVRLLSISSYRRSDETLRVDSDATGAPFLNVSADIKNRSFAQELQASGDHGSFNWVAGLFYFYLDKEPVLAFSGIFPSLPQPFGPFGTPFGTPFVIYANPSINAYAAYAQGTLELLPNTNLTLGARYTIEKHRIEGYTTGSPTLSPGSAGTLRKTFEKPTFRAALDHKITPDVMVYGSYNRGFNAGFFNQAAVTGFRETFSPAFPANVPNVPVDPESVDAYEIGVKSDWLERRLQVNLAGFLYDYTNLQQQIYQFGTLFTLNAASARIKGLDVDVTIRPVRNVTLSVSGNYLDATYRSYPLAPDAQVRPNGELVYIGARDARGKRLILAPKYGLQATLSHRLHTGIGTFDTTGNLNYQSAIYVDPQNQFATRGRTLISITQRWTANNEHLTVTAWAKNLTNEQYDVSATIQEHTGVLGNPGAPRTYGITVGYRF